MGHLVIGIDSSTQSTKAIAWDKNGKFIAEGRHNIPISNTSLNKFEQDVEDWWDAFCISSNKLVGKININDVDSIAISNQRETVAFLNKNGKSIYPAIVWMDKRCIKEVSELNKKIGKDKIHNITGRPPDPCPAAYKILWLKNNEPNIFNRVYCFADVQSFLVHRLTGKFNTGWISSDPHGMFDLQEKKWSKTILDYLEINENHLPKSFKTGTLLGKISKKASSQCGLKEGLPIFAAGGDGQLAGLGTNCTSSDRAYINLGSAVVSGIWSKKYVCTKNWRTELAAHGEGYIFENVLLSGAILVNWFVDQFIKGNRNDKNFFSNLELEISKISIGSNGLIFQPYASGVMDPYWDSDAKGVMIGLNLSHNPFHLYRSIIEGLTLDSVIRIKNIEKETNIKIKEYFAIGGGANNKVWTQMLSDASGKNVLISKTVEASSLGAAMIAAYGAGWYTSIKEAAKFMSGETKLIKPNKKNKNKYDDLIKIYKDIYCANKEINKRLKKFA